MRQFVEVVVRRPESDLAGYSSVRINPSMVYRVDTTLEQFASAIPEFQKETGLIVESIARIDVGSVEDFGKAMKINKIARYVAETMPAKEAQE